MRSSAVEIASLDGEGCGVRVTFAWYGDRYRQSIYGVTSGKATLLLESEEAPLQEAVEHKSADDRRALLFTGSDGRYWSAAVTAATRVGAAAVEFDFACRSARSEPSPTIAYRIAAGMTATHGRDGALVLGVDEGGAYQLQPADEAMPTCRLAVEDDRIIVKAVGSSWRYQVSLSVTPARS